PSELEPSAHSCAARFHPSTGTREGCVDPQPEMDPESGTLPLSGDNHQGSGRAAEDSPNVMQQVIQALLSRLRTLMDKLGPGGRAVGVENRFFYDEVEKVWKIEGGETDKERAEMEAKSLLLRLLSLSGFEWPQSLALLWVEIETAAAKQPPSTQRLTYAARASDNVVCHPDQEAEASAQALAPQHVEQSWAFLDIDSFGTSAAGAEYPPVEDIADAAKGTGVHASGSSSKCAGKVMRPFLRVL
ncbi:unnamed protein product, partial [Polarella glacialis]